MQARRSALLLWSCWLAGLRARWPGVGRVDMTRDIQADKLRREAEAARSLVAELQSDDETLLHDMVEGETMLFEAIDAAIDEMDECDIRAAGCKEKIKQLTERQKRAEARQERLRTLIEQAMLVADQKTIKRPLATLTVRDVAPRPMITEEAQIPSEYWRSPDPVVDKKKINEAIADGKTIPGVTMTNGSTSLTIRRA